MSRINTNIPSMVAQRVLSANNTSLTTSLNRLSTGLKINSGKDDPAGLIASETLRAEKAAINAALYNISRANNVIATAEGGLIEINTLLVELEDLIDKSANSAGISEQERNANQLQIDAILSSIDRFANTTEFQGRRLLSGELEYDTKNIDTAKLTNVSINAAHVPQGSERNVTVEVTASAQLAQVVYGTSTTGSGAITLEVVGNLGTEVLTFASGTAISTVANAINGSKELTGVSALVSGGALRIMSREYGSAQFVSVRVLDDNGSFDGNLSTGDGGKGKDYGSDASVTINGVAAITDGLRASVRTAVLSVDLDMSASFGTALGSSSFSILGGGADFMISPTVNSAGIASLGIPSVTTGNLGKRGLGFLADLATGKDFALGTGKFQQGQSIVREAQQVVSFLRGRLGAFQKDTLQTTANSLRVTLENTSAAESTIRETDFAAETAEMTRAQILAQAATQTLRLANSQPQNVLALLG
jgi:flagellin